MDLKDDTNKIFNISKRAGKTQSKTNSILSHNLSHILETDLSKTHTGVKKGRIKQLF